MLKAFRRLCATVRPAVDIQRATVVSYVQNALICRRKNACDVFAFSRRQLQSLRVPRPRRLSVDRRMLDVFALSVSLCVRSRVLGWRLAVDFQFYFLSRLKCVYLVFVSYVYTQTYCSDGALIYSYVVAHRYLLPQSHP